MTWATRTLGEICDEAGGFVQTGPFGSQLKQAEYIDDPEGIPVVMPKDIQNGKVDESGVARISAHKANALSRHFLAKGDIIFPRRGEIGKRAFISEPAKYFCGTGCLRIHLPRKALDSRFLFYFLDQELVVKWLEGRAIGSTMLNLNSAIVESVLVSYPGLDRQDSIVSVLSAYDDLIENNRRRIELLEKAARELYKEWFVRLRFPGHEHVKMVDGVPEGWRKQTLGDVAVTNEASYQAKDLPPVINYIDISSVDRGWINQKSVLTAEEAPGRARRIAKHGDVIWSNVRPNLKAYALVMSPEDADVFSTGFTVLTAKSVPYLYLYQFVTTDGFVTHLVNHTTGSSYPAVRPPDFERAEILVPARSLLSQFQEICEPSFRLINVLQKKSNALAQARDLLLPKLMSGEIGV